MTRKRASAIEVLRDRGLLSPEQASRAEERARADETPLTQALVDLGIVLKRDLLRVLGEAWGVKTVDLERVQVEVDSARMLPEAVCRRGRYVWVAVVGRTAFVAMADPFDIFLLEDMRLRTGLEPVAYLALPRDVAAALDRTFGTEQAAGRVMQTVLAEAAEERISEELEIRAPDAGESDPKLEAALESPREAPEPLSGPPPVKGSRGCLVPATGLDPADLSVFCPPSCAAGSTVLIQAFVHLPDGAAAAAALASEFDADARRRGCSSLGTRIARGSRLDFALSSRLLIVREPRASLVWQGRPASVQFEAQAPSGGPMGAAVASLTVSQDSVPIGEIKFKVDVTTPGGVSRAAAVGVGEARRYERAFVSYASPDRPEVLRRVQMLAPAGIRFFQDVIDLVPGQRWSDELYRKIDESDVLFLFWSRAAKGSEWVEREWRYALNRRGLEFIKPVILEGPPIPAPPVELAELHFNDRLLYFLKTAS